MRLSLKTAVCSIATMVMVSSSSAAIDDRGIADSRALGLGGADSASAKGSSGVLVNPAALGFMARSNENISVDNNVLSDQKFGWNVLDVGLAATLTGELGDYLETLAGVDFSRFESSELRKPENIKSLISMADAFGNISDQDTIVVNANMSSMVQFGHFGTGLRVYGQVGGWINELDLVNLGLQLAVSEIVDELDAAIADEMFDAASYDYQTLDPGNINRLKTALGLAPIDDEIVKYLDSKLTEVVEEVNLDRDRINGVVDALAEVIENSDTASSILDNQTSITGRGFLAAEIPVSYGYAFNDHFSLGITARAIFGRVYGTQVWAFNEDNTQILEESLNSSVDRVNVGLDLGAMYRINNFQFALNGYNLNRPKFDGYTQDITINGSPQQIQVPDVVLDPQVTFGAAWIPVRRFILATDIELLKTGTLLNGYDAQRISFGSEVDLSLVQLRLGTYRNIARDDLGWVLTAGLGFQLWALSADLGAAVSIDDTVNYDGVDYPRTARASLSVAMDF